MLNHSRDDPDRWQRLQDEAAHLASLHHPNIAQVIDLGSVEGMSYVITEFVPGRSLVKFLGNPSLPIGAVVELVQQIALAIGFCHARGVIHRDLKPSNVRLAPPEQGAAEDRHDSAARVFGVPKITDFERARVLSGTERKSAVLHRLLPHEEDRETVLPRALDGQVAGSPGCVAPEQKGDVAGHTPALDVWALGVILCELLTGESPFEEEPDPTRADIGYRVVPPSRRRPAVPWDLESVCLNCLRQRPEQRFADGNELAKALGHWLARWRRWPSNWWRWLMFWREP